MQQGDKFCGSCGAVVLPPAPQAEKVVSEPPLRPQSTSYAPRRRNRLWINVAAISLLLLVSIGAVAALALNSGLQDPEVAPVSPDAPPDPAFALPLQALEPRTEAPIMLPAELPDELKNVGIQENLEGDRYGIVFLSTPPEDLVGAWPMAKIRGSLEAVPASEYEPDQRFEATSTEDVELPDGTEAKLRHMQPVLRTAMYGSRWEGTFDKGGYTYTLSILVGQKGYVSTKQALSTMVEVE